MTQSKKGIFFAGAGGFFAYYWGIIKYIQENYDLENVAFGGYSAGSIAALMGHLKIDPQHMVEWLGDVKANNINAGFPLEDAMVGFDTVVLLQSRLHELIADIDIDELNKNCTFAVTNIARGIPITEFHDTWLSHSDFVTCILASCWIPGIFGSPTCRYLNGDYLDGGFNNFLIGESEPRQKKNGPEWITISLSTFKRFENELWMTCFSIGSLCISANEFFVRLLMWLGYEDAKRNDMFFAKHLSRK